MMRTLFVILSLSAGIWAVSRTAELMSHATNVIAGGY